MITVRDCASASLCARAQDELRHSLSGLSTCIAICKHFSSSFRQVCLTGSVEISPTCRTSRGLSDARARRPLPHHCRWWSGTRMPVVAAPYAGSGSSAAEPPSPMRDSKAWIAVHRAMAPPFYIAGGGAVLAGLASGALVLARHHCSCALRPRASDRLAAPVDDSLRPPRGGGRARLQGAGCPDDGGAQPSVMRDRAPEQRSQLGDTNPL